MNNDALAPGCVYDCMVFLQGAAHAAGPAAACLDLAATGVVELFLSPRVLAEVSDVLSRPKVRRKFPALTAEYVDEFMDALLRYATFVYDVPPVFAFERDPKDEPYINLALAVNVPYLVSRDRDLLDLGDAKTAEGADFRRRFPFLTILDPVEFLQTFSSSAETTE